MLALRLGELNLQLQVWHFIYYTGKNRKYTGGEKMIKPNEIECIDCTDTTSNYYVIKTNKGDVYRCEKCYEVSFMRKHRDEYANFTDGLQQAKKI